MYYFFKESKLEIKWNIGYWINKSVRIIENIALSVEVSAVLKAIIIEKKKRIGDIINKLNKKYHNLNFYLNLNIKTKSKKK